MTRRRLVATVLVVAAACAAMAVTITTGHRGAAPYVGGVGVLVAALVGWWVLRADRRDAA